MLVCSAGPYGFGPASKLETIAGAWRQRGGRSAFIGEGSAFECARRSRVFDTVLDGGTQTPAAERLLDAASAFLSVMERDLLAAAQARELPTFALDSLVWMRDRVPEAFLRTRRFWVQEFPGVRERLAALGIRADIIGPIVSGAASRAASNGARRGRRARMLVVHLGGGSSPLAPLAAPAYGAFTLSAIARSGIARGFADGIRVIGGEAFSNGAVEHEGCRWPVEAVSQEEACALFSEAALVLTAPGLTATFECFALGVPVVFLPPQNFSQWWILERLRRLDIAPRSFHWADGAETGIVECMPEAERVSRLRTSMEAQVADPERGVELSESLAAAAALDFDALAARQREFFASLGPIGTEEVVQGMAGHAD